MQTTSALYKTLMAKANHWFEIAVTIGNSGVLITEGKEWIDFGALYLSGSLIDSKTAVLVESGSPDEGVRENALISVKTSNQLFPDQKPSIGNAVSGQIDLELMDVGFNIPRMAEIRPYVRVTDGTETSEWIPQGVFYTDTRYITNNDDNLPVWTITGYDAMLKADQPYPYDNQEIASTVVKNIASLMGLAEDNIDGHVWEVIPINGGDTIQCSGEWTAREHLQYIGALYGGNWTITNEGKLNLVRINDIPYETNLLTDEHGFVLTFGSDTPEHTVTASGAVATFTAGGEYPLDDLQIAIEPVQDLHGYDNPYPAGGGKNKLPCEAVGSTISGIQFTVDNEGIVVAKRVDTSAPKIPRFFNYGHMTLPSGTYIANGITNGGAGTTYIEILSGAYDGQRIIYYTNGDNSFTLSAETDVYVRCIVATQGLLNLNEAQTYSPMIRLSSVTDATFAPNSNICPISGHTGVTVEQRGSNVLDITQTSLIYPDITVANDQINIASVRAGSISRVYFDQTFKAGAYTFSAKYSGGLAGLRAWCNTSISGWTYNAYYGGYYKDFPSDSVTFDMPEGAKVGIIGITGTAGTTATIYNIQLELGSTASPYEEYVGKTYLITFETEAGTVYYGELTIHDDGSCDLKVTHDGIDMGTVDYTINTALTGWDRYYCDFDDIVSISGSSTNIKAISSVFTATNLNAANSNPRVGLVAGLTKTVYFYTASGTYANASAFKTAMSGQQFVYELAVPVTYQLTPTEVKTLLGTNNVLANTGNIINLEFTEPATELVRIVIGQ